MTDTINLQNARRTTLIVDIVISADEFLRLYRGTARTVVAPARNGQMISFPATILQQFVSHDGVHGSFQIVITEENKLISIERL